VFRGHAGQCMTERDGSKARASAICIDWEHLPGMVGTLPKKRLADAYFGSSGARVRGRIFEADPGHEDGVIQ
jgi:hypothetical protein